MHHSQAPSEAEDSELLQFGMASLFEPSGRQSGATELGPIFARTLEALDWALLLHYAIPEKEAAEIRESLIEWFHRYARRPGRSGSLAALQVDLITMACRAGHVYCSSRLAEPRDPNQLVDRSLALGPEIIALEVAKHVASDLPGR